MKESKGLKQHLMDSKYGKDIKNTFKLVGTTGLATITGIALAAALHHSLSGKKEDSYRRDLNKAKHELNEKKFEILKIKKKYLEFKQSYIMYYNRGVELNNLLNTNLHAEQAKEYNKQYDEILKYLVEIGLEAAALEKNYLGLKEEANLKEADIATIQEYLGIISGVVPGETGSAMLSARPPLPNWVFPGLH